MVELSPYSAIAECGEIFAVQNGKRYRIGKDMRIDDINDIAVLSFVDAPPKTSTGLATGKTHLLGDRVQSVSNNREQPGWNGKLSNVLKREDVTHQKRSDTKGCPQVRNG
jgi:hypothetical protein